MSLKNYKTDQENFWAGKFGTEYIARNKSQEYLASNLNFFSRALRQCGRPKSIIEFGANIGMNLKAIKHLFPDIHLSGIEINEDAAVELARVVGEGNVIKGSILDFEIKQLFEVALIKGVLIHINPKKLPYVYEKLYEVSSRYILICEYYNPSPVTITYRGHNNRLFKRDFAGEVLEIYPDLRLIDYGFVYRRDPAFPQDDVTWFLLEKK
jgi:pseudaminic acid biosynthesis-associated methylase